MTSSPYQSPGTDPYIEPAGYLKGGKPLWKAFWLVHFLGLVLVYVVLRFGVLEHFAVPILELVQRWDAQFLGRAGWYVFALIALPPLLIYACFSLVVVWRCGRNTRWFAWTILARTVVVLTALFLAWAVAMCVWRIVS
ncbi:hypothetical protein K5Q02_01650 [Pseudomonas sp. MM211]|uniref:hypothetical protein n=1 Tax=Pseudomonas sp. MM211 TaxID=2866808 RepID=UPI001CEC04AD|nr:hypothetical protein [Pseudomonas sp. MM211]UCJ17126.1 hypothetical protein K5Q02_01650 [Pseudomonas sp. MM211]